MPEYFTYNLRTDVQFIYGHSTLVQAHYPFTSNDLYYLVLTFKSYDLLLCAAIFVTK